MSSLVITAEQRDRYEEVVAFWTPERMARAEPRRPRPGWVRPRPAPAPPGAFYTLLVQDPTKAPYCRAGKMYMTFKGNKYQGSACAVDENGILTAAHNLYDHDTETYADNAMYMPGYNNGAKELGRWPLLSDPVPVFPIEWYENVKEYGFDYGFSMVGPGGKDKFDLRPIGKVTGIFEIIVDKPDIKEWTTLGYPGKTANHSEWDGEQMYSCYGTKEEIDFNHKVAKYGDLCNGTSGGPWLLTGAHRHMVNGLTASFAPGYDLNFSPYFDQAVMDLFDEIFRSGSAAARD